MVRVCPTISTNDEAEMIETDDGTLECSQCGRQVSGRAQFNNHTLTT